MAGALGSKLTGGGGGGASVALTRPDSAETLTNVLKLITPQVFKAEINAEGVTVERLQS
ncbi:MAG: hypothetical protein QXM76_01175 [Zestosphaera sp.]